MKENKKKWFIDGNKKYRIHWSSNGMGAGVAIILKKNSINTYVTLNVMKGEQLPTENHNTLYSNLKVNTASFTQRSSMDTFSYETLNKNWRILKNIIIEAADQAMHKMKKQNHNKTIKRSMLRSFKIAKALSKMYRFMKQERSKSLKWIRGHERFQKEEKKLVEQNYNTAKMYSECTTLDEITDALRKESLHFQGISKTERRRETLRWEDLKENPKRMINSILDRPRQSIVMDRLIEQDDNSDPIIISDEELIKNKVRKHFHEWTWKRNFNMNLLNKWHNYYEMEGVDSSWYDGLLAVAADQAMHKMKKQNHNKTIKRSMLRSFKIAKALSKMYRFMKQERSKSLKWIRGHERFQKEEKKLVEQNYNTAKMYSECTTLDEITDALRKESLHFQGISKTERRRETLRWEDLKENPKRMINSILDRPRQSIVMDRLIEQDDNSDPIIISDEELIKNKVRKHFHEWTWKRNFNMNLLNKWHNYYEMEGVDSSWYDGLLAVVSMEELMDVIMKLPNKKAPGQSNLQYEWFKHLPTNAIEIFKDILNISIDLNDIPRMTIYILYLKLRLGETTSISQDRSLYLRLDESKHKILLTHNYTGLPDAHANKRKLWIMFQDMSKAFDSVNSDSLDAALRRIKVPEHFINMIGSILQNRENQVITIHGNTLPYKVEDEWTDNLHISSRKRLKLRVSVAAYVDDTNWFALNKMDIKQILEIANEFYQMNDIAINKNKSYLIAINANPGDRSQGVNMGLINLKPVVKDFPTRRVAKVQDLTYQLWWLSITETDNNNIGSGIGFMLKSNITKHIYKVDRLEGHGISILLPYKGKTTIQLIGIYAPNKYSTNKNILRQLKPWLYNQVSQALSNDWISIIMGDWNTTPNPSIDRNLSKTKTSPESSLLQSIIWNGYIDTYRSRSRIDSVWINQQYEEYITGANIDNTTLTQNKRFVSFEQDAHQKINQLILKQRMISKSGEPIQIRNIELETKNKIINLKYNLSMDIAKLDALVRAHDEALSNCTKAG
ncbi:hypothetical protein Glove_186g87 [Diversispora epigaea]|uniref:Reverse transcriptase domain-containing protein n=1 Tax=Diversispora epigaea TaxID=1348612 RepID=A0A397ILX9_9GLOM|nr:hypothetical protein Glove_186g87 [Diversispora epigaea]